MAYVECALELDPKYSRALTQKGYVLGRTGHPREALEFLRRAVDADPLNSSAWSYKAREERYAKLTGDAIASYDRILELARNFSVHPVLVEEAQEWIEKLTGQAPSGQP